MAEPKTGFFDVVMYRYDPTTNELVPQLPTIMQGYYGTLPGDFKSKAVRAEQQGDKIYYYIPKQAVIEFYPETFEEQVIDQISNFITTSLPAKFVKGAAETRTRVARDAQDFLKQNFGTVEIDPKTGLPLNPALPSPEGALLDGTRSPASMISPRVAERAINAASFAPLQGGILSNLGTADARNEVYLFWDRSTGAPRAINAEEFINSRTIPGKEFNDDEIKTIAESLRGTVYLDENYDKLGPAEARIALREAVKNVAKVVTEANYSVLRAGVTDPSQYIDVNDYIRNAKFRNATTGSTTSTTTSLTGRGGAAIYATNAAREYLGRNPTKKEIDKFTNALNAAERAAPTVTTTTPQTGGGTSTFTTTGGVSGQIEAEEFMRRQPGAGSYQIATNYFDAFIRAIGNPTRVPTPQ